MPATNRLPPEYDLNGDGRVSVADAQYAFARGNDALGQTIFNAVTAEPSTDEVEDVRSLSTATLGLAVLAGVWVLTR